MYFFIAAVLLKIKSKDSQRYNVLLGIRHQILAFLRYYVYIFQKS